MRLPCSDWVYDTSSHFGVCAPLCYGCLWVEFFRIINSLLLLLRFDSDFAWRDRIKTYLISTLNHSSHKSQYIKQFRMNRVTVAASINTFIYWKWWNLSNFQINVGGPNWFALSLPLWLQIQRYWFSAIFGCNIWRCSRKPPHALKQKLFVTFLKRGAIPCG